MVRGGALLIAVVASACADRLPDSSHRAGDTTFVFSSVPERATGSLREVLRIGQVDGPPEYLFARISMLAVGPGGDIFVAQVDGDLREYDAEGRFVRTVARGGQGPGEVEYVVAMDVAEDGRLWLTDGGRLWAWPGATGSSREVTSEERESLSQFLGGRSAPSRFWTFWSPTDGLDVFDGDGHWVGHVDTPVSWDGDPFPGLADPYFRGDTIWAVTKDELDIRYVSKFVIEWPSSS